MVRLVPVLLAFAAGLVAMIKLLPWWGSLLGLIGLALGTRLLAGRVFRRVLLRAFRAKSAALKGAQATLQGLALADPPKPDEDDEEDFEAMGSEASLKWVRMDLSIHVPEGNGGKTPFQLWDPYELSIAPVDAKPGMEIDDEDELGRVEGIEVYDAGNWIAVDGKLQGSQRIRIHAGVREDVQHFKLRYYFEIIENRATL